MLKEIIVLERWPDGLPKVLYERIGLGMLFAERELVLSFRREIIDGGQIYHVMSIDHPDYPETNEKVRMKIFKRSKLLTQGNNLKIEELVNMSMGGYVPAGLLNMMIGSMYQKGLDQQV